MKKEHTRDYVVAMFRFYALHGEPDSFTIQKLKTKLSTAAIQDLEAVDNTLRELDDETKSAIKYVYFLNPEKEIRKNDIERRVIRFSLDYHLDRSSTYRRLKKARKICAQKRNLNF